MKIAMPFARTLFFSLAAIMATARCGDLRVDTDDIKDLLKDPPVKGDNIKLTVQGFGSVDIQTAAAFEPANIGVLTVSNPVTPQYSGIGQHVGSVVVDGFKIKLTGVEAIGSGEHNTVGLFDWSAAPKELEVAAGFSGSLTDSGNLPAGTYKAMRLNVSSHYSIRAWAYLDTDNNNEVDTTVWTTAAGIVSDSTEIAAITGMAGYDYFEYTFLYGSTAQAVNDSGGASEFTYFPAPFVVDATDATVGPSASTTATTHDIGIRLDTFRVAKVWDGIGERGDTFGGGFLTGNNAGIPAADLFPDNEPNFGLSYLPLFGLFDDANAVAETYEVSNANTFLTGYTQLVTIVFSGAGAPLFGRIRDRGGLDLNQMVSLFTAGDGGTYSFKNGDGDLLYNGTPEDAQFTISGFKQLAVGAAAQAITVENGPKCSAAAAGCAGSRTGFMRRVNRD